jgi:triosephosphate isomerase
MREERKYFDEDASFSFADLTCWFVLFFVVIVCVGYEKNREKKTKRVSTLRVLFADACNVQSSRSRHTRIRDGHRA